MSKVIIVDLICIFCNGETHSLQFRRIENKLVYFSKKCTKCKHTCRSNTSIEQWKNYLDEHDHRLCLTKHHRKCKSNGGGDEPSNISLVSHKKHQAWHQVFANKSIEKIVEELNNIWIPPNIKLVITKI